MKTILTIVLLTFGLQSYSQNCTLPAITGQQVGQSYRFTLRDDGAAIYRIQWKDPNAALWTSLDVQLSWIAPGHGNCQGQVCKRIIAAIENQTYSGSLFYGIHDGWLVRFAKKCPDGLWTPFSQEFTVSF